MNTNTAKCRWDGEKMIHIWIYSGDSNYFPYEGMPCDCGETKYHLERIKKEDDSHNTFKNCDYFVRKMTFGKIKYN